MKVWTEIPHCTVFRFTTTLIYRQKFCWTNVGALWGLDCITVQFLPVANTLLHHYKDQSVVLRRITDIQTGCRARQASCTAETGVVSGVERQGSDFGHWAACSAEPTNGWGLTSTPMAAWRGQGQRYFLLGHSKRAVCAEHVFLSLFRERFVQEAICCNVWPSRGESSPRVLRDVDDGWLAATGHIATPEYC